jgi:Leucine-rich repeat (LRR) protein
MHAYVLLMISRSNPVTVRLDGNLTEWTTMGELRSLQTLDLYNNQMVGDVPASLQNLTSLQYLYLDNIHLTPLRQWYCGERIPNNGKYNYRIVRDEYIRMTSIPCDDMHDVNFAFNSLQVSGVYPD